MSENAWIKRVIVGWALFLGAFGAVGWGVSESWAQSVVSLFACAMMLVSSHMLREAQGRRWATRIFAASLVLFGAWSGYSAHHAVEATRSATLGDLEGFFLLTFFTCSAMVDPFQMWAVRDTEKAVAAETGAGAAPKLATVNGAVVSGAGAAAMVAATVNGVTQGVAGLPEAVYRLPDDMPAMTAQMSYADAREHAFALRLQFPRMSVTGIARQVGRPRSTVSDWFAAEGLLTARA